MSDFYILLLTAVAIVSFLCGALYGKWNDKL